MAQVYLFCCRSVFSPTVVCHLSLPPRDRKSLLNSIPECTHLFLNAVRFPSFSPLHSSICRLFLHSSILPEPDPRDDVVCVLSQPPLLFSIYFCEISVCMALVSRFLLPCLGGLACFRLQAFAFAHVSLSFFVFKIIFLYLSCMYSSSCAHTAVPHPCLEIEPLSRVFCRTS